MKLITRVAPAGRARSGAWPRWVWMKSQPTCAWKRPEQRPAPAAAVPHVGAVGIALLVGERVVLAVIGHPRDHRALDRHRAERGEDRSQRPAGGEAAVRQMAVEADRHAQAGEQVQDHEHRDVAPAQQVGPGLPAGHPEGDPPAGGGGGGGGPGPPRVGDRGPPAPAPAGGRVPVVVVAWWSAGARRRGRFWLLITVGTPCERHGGQPTRSSGRRLVPEDVPPGTLESVDRRSASPEQLPPLRLRRLRGLDLEQPSRPGRAAHLARRAGGAAGDFVYVIGDDELFLAVFELSSARPGRLHRALSGEMPLEHGARSGEKPDLEALTVLPPFERNPYGALLGLGSGSAPERDRGFVWALAADGSLQGEAREVDLEPVYGLLRRHIAELNVEVRRSWATASSCFSGATASRAPTWSPSSRSSA